MTSETACPQCGAAFPIADRGSCIECPVCKYLFLPTAFRKAEKKVQSTKDEELSTPLSGGRPRCDVCGNELRGSLKSPKPCRVCARVPLSTVWPQIAGGRAGPYSLAKRRWWSFGKDFEQTVAGFVVFGVASGVVWLLAVGILSMKERADADDKRIDAIVKAKLAVEAQLKNPSSASHPWGGGTTTKQKDGSYTVESYVDATNGFGATIRTPYKATVDKNGNVNVNIGQ